MVNIFWLQGCILRVCFTSPEYLLNSVVCFSHPEGLKTMLKIMLKMLKIMLKKPIICFYTDDKAFTQLREDTDDTNNLSFSNVVVISET
jgi:hypothetical protein